jgi:hypothetical protein
MTIMNRLYKTTHKLVKQLMYFAVWSSVSEKCIELSFGHRSTLGPSNEVTVLLINIECSKRKQTNFYEYREQFTYGLHEH